MRKATRTTSSVARRRRDQLPFYSGCLTRHMCEPARRMRPTNGGMRLIVRPWAHHAATMISAHCQGYLIKPVPDPHADVFAPLAGNVRLTRSACGRLRTFGGKRTANAIRMRTSSHLWRETYGPSINRPTAVARPSRLTGRPALRVAQPLIPVSATPCTRYR